MDFSSLNNSDWQNLLYLVLLLTMLLAGLFSRRNLQYGKILKYLAAWAAIALVIIAFYSYRYEFSDLKDRVVAEINPSKAKFDENNGTLTIRASEDGHFYLDVKINATMVRFMVDTGASEITLSNQELSRLGIDSQKLNFNRAYQTANGTSFGAAITLDEIEIGGVKFYDVPASVNNGNMGTSLLGMSFLRKFKRYEFYRDTLVLEI